MLDGIQELTGTQELHPGGHNWPDMQVVVDPSITDVADGEIYLVQVQDCKPVVKALKDQGNSWRLSPALATMHGQSSANLFGKTLSVQSIEFTDSYYKRYVTVLGKVVGIWAAPTQS
jgi:SOS-response transcriptional repressor LexA